MSDPIDLSHYVTEKNARTSDRRPSWLTPQMMETLYHRWKEWVIATHRRDALVAAHPKWRGLYNQFLERLSTDPWWLNANALLIDNAPRMLFSLDVPEDDLLIAPKPGVFETPAEFFGPTGFGRLSAAAPRIEGPQPWSEAKIPPGQQQPLTSDEQKPLTSGDDEAA